MKETTVNFFLNVLSVILGIVITFTIQGMIDRAGDKKEVRSALELVRSELSTNLGDISIMTDYLAQERQSADYFRRHEKDLSRCPADSVQYHSGILFAEASITASNDALELLKMSSLFQKVGNNALSMRIIRAYDCCASIVPNLNRHISTRNTRFEEVGRIDVKWLSAQADPALFADVSDIEEAIAAIDAYLKKH